MALFSRISAFLCVAAVALTVAIRPVSAEETNAPLPQATRIAAIGGSVTEIVYALGEEGRLVARDTTSVFPEEALKLPDVGYMRQLSPEGVLSVNPDAIIALQDSGPPEALDVLKKASVPLVVVPETFSREGILEKIKIVGHALGADEKATELAGKVENDIKAAEALTANIPQRKRVLFVLSVQGGKILASGTGTAANGIITMAGAENVIADFQGYKQLSDEAVITAKPDVILMMDRGGGGQVTDAEVLAHPAIAPTPAGEAKSLIRMDGAYLLGFGPRTASAIRDLSTALYGEQVQN